MAAYRLFQTQFTHQNGGYDSKNMKIILERCVVIMKSCQRNIFKKPVGSAGVTDLSLGTDVTHTKTGFSF